MEVNSDSNIHTPPPGQTPEVEGGYANQIRHIFKLPTRRHLKYIPGGRFAPAKITRSQSSRVAPKKITEIAGGDFFRTGNAVQNLTSVQVDKLSAEENGNKDSLLPEPGCPNNSTSGGYLIKRAWFFHRQASSQVSSNTLTVNDSNPTASSVEDVIEFPKRSPAYPVKNPIHYEPPPTCSGLSLTELPTTNQSYSSNAPTTIAHLEKEIIEKIQTFPTVVLQQTKGRNFTSKWSWQNVLQKHHKNVEVATDDCEKFQISHNFYLRVNTAGLILEQIRHDFQNGLRPYNERSDDCHAMEVCQVRVRGRTVISDNMIHHLQEIFQCELNKQAIYSKWMSQILTNEKEAKQRNGLVAWVMRTAKIVLYAAETTHLAVYFIDAFLGAKGNKITPGWRLLGITALHIAGKLEEKTPATLQLLIKLFDSPHKNEEVCSMEKYILEKIQFNLCPPLPPVFVQLVLYGGSLEFPNIHMRKLALDLSKGMLYRSLLNHELVAMSPADKAKAALEIAVDFLFYQYNVCVNRDMTFYETNNDSANCDPGLSLGELVLNLCTETFTQRFLNRKLPLFIPAVTCMASPVRDVKV